MSLAPCPCLMCTRSVDTALSDALARFVERQKDIPADFARILSERRSELYVETDEAAPRAKGEE